MGRAVGLPVRRGLGRAVGDPCVDLADGVADGAVLRPRVRDGVGSAVGCPVRLAAGVGVGLSKGKTGAGVGVAELMTCDGRCFPLPGTGMSGAEALGSSRPTPGIDSGSSPGEDAMLTANNTR